MKLLMIGGTGCLSTAVAAEALRNGVEVTMMNRGNRKIPDGAELIKCDFKDSLSVACLLKERCFDVVIDFISYTEKDVIYSYRMLNKHVAQYIFISSCSVYAQLESGGVCCEDHPRGKIEFAYSLGKYACETILSDLYTIHGCPYTIIRPAVTFGDSRIPYGIVPPYGRHWTLVGRALAGKPIITWDNGENRVNMMHVDDFAVGVVGLLGNKDAYCEAFNICGDERPTYNEVLDYVGEAINKDILRINIDRQFYGEELSEHERQVLNYARSGYRNYSNARIKKFVSEFKCSISVKAGIERTIEAYKRQNYQRGIDWAFDADTDRIILKWCKLKKIDPTQYNLRFVDYIGTATIKDKFLYWRIVHSGSILGKVVNLACKSLSKLKSL